MAQICKPTHIGCTPTRAAPSTHYQDPALFCSPSASALGLPPFGLSSLLAASNALRLFLPFGSASSFFAGARVFTAPPVFSTATTADFEARQTESSILLLSSPSPRSFTPPFSRRISPACNKRVPSRGPWQSIKPPSFPV